MFLKEVDLGDEIKCVCSGCMGTGVHKGIGEPEDIAVVCQYCNGKGYNVLTLDENMQLVKDEEKNITYLVKNGVISGIINLFDKLKIKPGVNYVMYETGIYATHENFDPRKNEFEVISYADFINGKLPLPIKRLSCPRQFTQSYAKEKFNNDCPCYGAFKNCERYNTDECWTAFYEGAKTAAEKQRVLRKMK